VHRVSLISCGYYPCELTATHIMSSPSHAASSRRLSPQPIFEVDREQIARDVQALRFVARSVAAPASAAARQPIILNVKPSRPLKKRPERSNPASSKKPKSKKAKSGVVLQCTALNCGTRCELTEAFDPNHVIGGCNTQKHCPGMRCKCKPSYEEPYPTLCTHCAANTVPQTSS
jgi:hypothetical protein